MSGIVQFVFAKDIILNTQVKCTHGVTMMRVSSVMGPPMLFSGPGWWWHCKARRSTVWLVAQHTHLPGPLVNLPMLENCLLR